MTDVKQPITKDNVCQIMWNECQSDFATNPHYQFDKNVDLLKDMLVYEGVDHPPSKTFLRIRSGISVIKVVRKWWELTHEPFIVLKIGSREVMYVNELGLDWLVILLGKMIVNNECYEITLMKLIKQLEKYNMRETKRHRTELQKHIEESLYTMQAKRDEYYDKIMRHMHRSDCSVMKLEKYNMFLLTPLMCDLYNMLKE